MSVAAMSGLVKDVWRAAVGGPHPGQDGHMKDAPVTELKRVIESEPVIRGLR